MIIECACPLRYAKGLYTEVMETLKVVVIGGSAGGVELSLRLARDLPKDLDAAVFIVIHLSPSAPSAFAELLNRRSALPVAWAQHGEPIQPGRIYLCPPDLHLLLEERHMCLGRGPRENGHRPAVDPLFRTAAHAHGPRVVGVIISGNLDDGSIGLREIRAMGGKAIVQNPDDAIYNGMPLNAIEEAGADAIVPAADLAATIAEFVRDLPGAANGENPLPDDIADGGEAPMSSDEREDGAPSVFGCPDCGGVLWEVEEDEIVRYRCRVGHAYSDESLLSSQTEGVERAMWAALRTLEESAEQAHRLARRMRSRGHGSLHERFRSQALDHEERAGIIRRALLTGG